MTTEKTVGKTAEESLVKEATVRAKPGKKSVTKLKGKDAPQADAKAPRKTHKVKVVRDSFTMPQDEYAKIAEIKAICVKAKMHVKKSEVLRAGLKLLAGLDTTQLRRALGSLEKIKTGRPQKH